MRPRSWRRRGWNRWTTAVTDDWLKRRISSFCPLISFGFACRLRRCICAWRLTIVDVATVAAGASLISLLQDLSFPDDIYLNFERVIQQLDFQQHKSCGQISVAQKVPEMKTKRDSHPWNVQFHPQSCQNRHRCSKSPKMLPFFFLNLSLNSVFFRICRRWYLSEFLSDRRAVRGLAVVFPTVNSSQLRHTTRSWS